LKSQDQTLSMTMNHAAVDVPPAAMSDCKNCHGDAANTNYYPGTFHSALVNLDFTQPASCSDCHTATMPTGFVGPAATNPPRTPSSGEMKHDAVAWPASGPTSVRLVPTDCAPCHRPPADKADASWATSKTGGMTALYHQALTAAGVAQPMSCIDCHANT